MSAFNPKKKELPAICWQKLAHESLEESSSGSQVLIIGGIVGGLLGASITGFPPTGLLIGGWAFYEAWRRTAALNKNEQAIAQHGCIAHLLTQEKLRDFTNQVGEQEVKRQIEWASENGYSLTADAEEFLESQQQSESVAIAGEAPQRSDLLKQAIAIFQREPRESSESIVEAPSKTTGLQPFDRARIINESKGLMIIGDMGAAKTCVAQYIANGFNDYGIIIFDPHGRTDWGSAYVITKMPAIYQQMAILLERLENGDESPLLIICDEWLEIRGARLNKSGDFKGVADDFIRLFSTKPRKFNKLAAFVLHSPNVEAAGVDSFLRENYLKVYLGRLAKKEFPSIKDCAYPCVIEGEQFEHPTHGHHEVFRPTGNAPRNLQPLNSAVINIPLTYMDRGKVKVHQGGWDKGSFIHKTDIRHRLEFLLNDLGTDTGIDTGTDTGTRERTAKNSDTGTDTGIDTSDTESDTADTGSAETIGNTGGSGDTERDTSDTFTPAQLPRVQVVQLVEQMKVSGFSQTQIIQALWGCEKNKAGWKQAYTEFKELTEGSDEK
ncbi:hypothetical protein H6F78_17055 [Coleofasciculus sp. FACHB-64]|uniref:hypothetical protein n=1 Tax=Cyanophyceae TaxID=3028117 RepID=UPI001683BA37|nr:hypothetical protein [Coleofasciculus sp. FACHB-64]MBD2047280.1 hypothetical protein [Coleofasciculus sp. FACHB-64]